MLHEQGGGRRRHGARPHAEEIALEFPKRRADQSMISSTSRAAGSLISTRQAGSSGASFWRPAVPDRLFRPLSQEGLHVIR